MKPSLIAHGLAIASCVAPLVTRSVAAARRDAGPCPGDVNASGDVSIDDLLAIINAWADHAATRVIHVANFQFTPDVIDARAGDTILWTLDSGLHTVTSGFGCGSDGKFDAAINAAHPQFQYTLQPKDVGIVGYFCNPHCGQNMIGSVQVAPFPADLTADGIVDHGDLLAVLDAWGPCR